MCPVRWVRWGAAKTKEQIKAFWESDLHQRKNSKQMNFLQLFALTFQQQGKSFRMYLPYHQLIKQPEKGCFIKSFSKTENSTHVLLLFYKQMLQREKRINEQKLTLSRTLPTSVIFSTSLALFRSLWINAKSTFKRSAIDVTLYIHDNIIY